MTKNFTRLLFVPALLMALTTLFSVNHALSQCTNNNVLYNVNATPSGAGNTVLVECMYGGEYVNVNVCAGADYIFSSCGAGYDTQLTLFTSTGTYLAFDDDGCGSFGPSTLYWTATFTGTVRLLLDEYDCISNSTCTDVTVTQSTSCGGGCDIYNVDAYYSGCDGTQELVTFYADYDGLCAIEGLYLYSDVLGWEYIDLAPYGFTSGDAIEILLGLDNTTYIYYFELSDGSTSADEFYTTGTCPAVSCTFNFDDSYSFGCDGNVEIGSFTPYYTGACSVSGMWINTTVTGWTYIDLSLDGLFSGDPIYLNLPEENTLYSYQYELSDGTLSPTYTYFTGVCGLCQVTDVQTLELGCNNGAEEVNFYVYYTGGCSVYSMWVYTALNGWEEVVLSGTDFSGDPIGINLLEDNTTYQYYFELSDGSTSDTYFYQTGTCDLVTCSVTDVVYNTVGCIGDAEQANFYVYYTGPCSVTSMWAYTTTTGWEEIVLTGTYLSGDPIAIDFLLDNTFYEFYFELSDGSVSSTYLYLTGNCDLATCSVTDVVYNTVGCIGDAEQANFYVYYTGPCSVTSMWAYTTTGGWEEIVLTGTFLSGDQIAIDFLLDNTFYEFYFELSDGSVSSTYLYLTGNCDSPACNILNVEYLPVGCVGSSEQANFYVNYTGACSVYSMWVYTTTDGWNEIVLAGTYLSGDAISIDFLMDNTTYQYYFELNDGTTSDTYLYITGTCDADICTNLTIDYEDTGCYETVSGNVPSGDIIPFYIGNCTVAGVYSSVDGGPYEYLDLSAYGFTSGDNMGLIFNVQDASYSVYYVLDNGSASPVTTFITTTCETGETICDCAGTQLPIEATSWLGDGSLDDGTYFWNGDLDLPVDFNCGTWGFDCGDELEAGFFAYDPYGVCSGNLPPSNGCVDEFCYEIDLDVTTDCFPDETSVIIYNSNGDIVFLADEFNFLVNEYDQLTFSMCLPAGCYYLEVLDSFGDGMSSADCVADGFVGVWDWNQSAYVTYVYGDSFDFSFAGEFCVGPVTECEELEMTISEEPCYPSDTELLPSISYTFNFFGNCEVASIYYAVNGGDFTELDVSAENWGSGDMGYLYYLEPNADYVIYYTTDDGASSFLYNFSTGDCANEITICDCDGTVHTIGVTSWLGDGYADNGFYQWNGQDVNFNCSTWGYDCGDIAGSPAFDPYDVCGGQLPPNNGCNIVNEILGCTDPNAINYNPQATINDGSCFYDLLVGCTDPLSCNYNDLALVDDGSCEYITCAGCTDPDATNYDPTATIDNGTCLYFEIPGCTDEDAMNYDPIATTDDGSCIYDCVWPVVFYEEHCTQGDLNNFYIDVEVSALGNGAPYTITNTINNQQQVMSLTGSFTMGPFANGTPVVIQVTSNILECYLTSQPITTNCAAGGVYGCTDPEALNYNPEATIDDGSCIYINVEEIEVAHFAMYPNPAKDVITISNNGSLPVVDVRIMDGLGKLIMYERMNISSGSKQNIDVSDFAQGNYVLEITSDQHTEHHSLIIQR